MSQRVPLPIDKHLLEIVNYLEAEPNLILKASPGSGKTTRVCPALLASRYFSGEKRQVLVLEPRRLAAKFAATRVAEEMNQPVGETVGYQFRFESAITQKTRLLFLTEGMLMRRASTDPLFSNVAAVILDEFHERHVQADIALSYLRWLQLTKRPDLRILVMSATLETGPLSHFLGGANVIELVLPMHEVETHFLSSRAEAPFENLVEKSTRQALSGYNKPSGHVLIFLPGIREIRKCEKALASVARENKMRIQILHGDLEKEKQNDALSESQTGKIILSTNIAESSLTINGVHTVIDLGMQREASYSWWSGIPTLKTRPASKASLIQRAGRAGRTASGQCFRLFTKADYDGRPPFDTPEIQRADLSQGVLELCALGVKDATSFPWFEAPSPNSLKAVRELLYRLGAIDSDGHITALGKRMAALPMHPRIARFMIEAEKYGLTERAALLAALLSEGELDSINALEFPQSAPSFTVSKVRGLFLSHFQQGKRLKTSPAEELLGFCLLCGFPDRVAKKRTATSSTLRQREGMQELLFCMGGSGYIRNSPALQDDELFVVLDIQESIALDKKQMTVRSVCPVSAEWLLELTPSPTKYEAQCLWDSQRERVSESTRLTYDNLVLEESFKNPAPSEKTSKVLIKNCFGIDPEKPLEFEIKDWIHAALKFDPDRRFETAICRIILAVDAKIWPELPAISSPDLAQAVEEICAKCLSKKDLQDVNWNDALSEYFLKGHAPHLDRLFPLTLPLSRGRRCPIHYRLGLAPSLESRIQDFFGLRHGPTLGNGKFPVVLNLLAPNGRAVQVTNDLANFWKSHYPQVRKELSRRYPRHPWPENPQVPLPEKTKK